MRGRPPETYYVYMEKTSMLVGVFMTHKTARASVGHGRGRAMVNVKDADIEPVETGGQRVVLKPREQPEKRTRRPW